MVSHENAKNHISETCGKGWLTFVDIIYDNLTSEITINSVAQKYGGLKVDYIGENENFKYLTENIYYLSQFTCEKCGKSAKKSIIDDWETTLCDLHFGLIESKVKFRIESISF